MASHGDFWNILGTSLHRVGLTANGVGLHVRLAEIEKENKKRSMIFLSAEPAAVMRFLGLEEGRFWEGYGTQREMWACICRSRFWRRESYGREGMRASERKRWEAREGYRGFVEWVESTTEQQNGEDGQVEGMNEMMREEVLEEGLEVFGKRREYEERVEQWRKEQVESAKRQGLREERKARAVEQGEYADAWIGCLERRGWAGAGAGPR